MSDIADTMCADMERYLAQFAGEKALFIPNEGNVGDCLIFTATLDALSKASIDVEIADNNADFRDRIVFLGGGGNLVGLYRGMRETIESCRDQAARIILLPHTIRGNVDLIRRLDHRATIWCRDVRSLEHVRACNPNLDLRLGHDMAFHCDVDGLLHDPQCAMLGLPMIAAALERHHTSLERLSSLPVVRFMRTDREALSHRTRTDLDVSRAFGRVADAETSKRAAWCFLKTILAAKRVVTDRLHVAIACALLRKNCELVDNSYNKNREIFAHSLHRFGWISFSQSAGATIADQPSSKTSIFSKATRHTQRLRDRIWGASFQ